MTLEDVAGMGHHGTKIITNSKPSERQIEEVISRGGTVAAALQKSAQKHPTSRYGSCWKDMPDRINAAMAKRQIKPSMNVWRLMKQSSTSLRTKNNQPPYGTAA